MNKLYQFHWDCGRMGHLYGLFIAEEADVSEVVGEEIYFGEVLGKHSEIVGTLEEGDLTVKSEDQDLIKKLQGIFGDHLSGFNPLDYYDPEQEPLL